MTQSQVECAFFNRLAENHSRKKNNALEATFSRICNMYNNQLSSLMNTCKYLARHYPYMMVAMCGAIDIYIYDFNTYAKIRYYIK